MRDDSGVTDEIADKHLFMMCRRLDQSALRDLPAGYHFRLCRPDELELWKDMQLANVDDAPRSLMDDYYAKWYAPKGDLFFQRCTFVCDGRDVPVGSAFLWKQYDLYTTVHWFKVLPAYEGRGLGRAFSRTCSVTCPTASTRCTCTPMRAVTVPSSCTPTSGSPCSLSPRSSTAGRTK